MEEKFIISIGRQTGSGGLTIATELSKQLGIPCFDKELIQLASEESGLGKEFFENIDEKTSHSLFGGLFGFRNTLVDEVYSGVYLSNESLFNIQSDVIRGLAEKESSIFIGRCADYVLKNSDNCLNIFICANTNDRVQRISEIREITEKKALDLIEKSDKTRASYYNYFSNKEWGKAESYHLCINSSVLGIDETVAFILEFAAKKFGDIESNKK